MKETFIIRFIKAQSLAGTLMGVMALKTPQATTADHKSGRRWLHKPVFVFSK